MRRSLGAATLTVTACSAILILGGGAASAAPPVGSCTNSYNPYTFSQLAFDPDAQAIFSVIDTNGDGVVCFKFYPNGPHAGHFGNLVDNKAAPHT